MNHVTFSDLLNFIACPYRQELAQKVSPELALREIYTKVAKFLFTKKYLDINVHFKTINNYFNSLWNEQKDLHGFTYELPTLLSLRHNITSLMSLLHPEDEVIAAELPVYLEVDNYIIHDVLDCFIFNKSNNTLKAIKLYTRVHGSDEFDILYISIYLHLVLSEFKQYKDFKNIDIIIYDPYTKREYKANKKSSQIYRKLLKNVVNTYSNKVWFPKPSRNNCFLCNSKTFCEWTISK